MEILLINPPFEYFSRHLLLSEPLSLSYLAAYLKSHNFKVNILDAIIGGPKKKGRDWYYGLNDEEIMRKVREFKPDVVGITCSFSLRIETTLRIARLIKKIDNSIITVVGGIHPTIFPLETVHHEYIDYVIVGEGEKSFLELIKSIESSKSPFETVVDGCAYKENGQIKLNEKKDFVEDLDSIPFPARELLSMEFYINRKTILYGLGQKRSASIITSRSCPHRCTFCSMYLMHGPKWRGRSAENVFGEVKLLVEKYKVREIFFMDDNLTFNKERMIKLCEMILQNGIKIKWNTPNGVSVINLDKDVVSLMKKSGCINICIGIESGSEEVRNCIIKKRLSDENIRKALSVCKEIGLPVIGFFIIGIPGETKHTYKDSIRMVKSLPLSMINTSFFTPFPGTVLYNECIDKGYIKEDYWKTIRKFNEPIVETTDFNKKTLKRWEKKIYYEFMKSHFWNITFKTVTLENDILKPSLVARTLSEKFCLKI